MAPLIAIAEMFAAAALVLAAAMSLRNRRVSAVWWVAMVAAMIIGVVFGVWMGFNFAYQPSPGLWVYSFPVPGAFHVLETYGDGTQQWVDFVTPAPLLVAFANACVFPGLAAAIVWWSNVVLSRFQSDRGVGTAR